jgi:hypothetical protein
MFITWLVSNWLYFEVMKPSLKEDYEYRQRLEKELREAKARIAELENQAPH